MSQELVQHHDSASSTQLAVTNETAGAAAAAQSKALVEARYTMAVRFPRNEDEVRQKLLKECKRPSFAAVAIYRKPIGQGIEGPSIRFAETAIRLMKNITIETMTVYDDREKRIVRVMVTDLEANVPYSQDVTIEKTVERRSVKQGDEVLRSRTNKQGITVHIIVGTDDDILNKQNALISKAIRTQGLRLVPGDLIDEAMTAVYATRRSEDAKDPDAAKRSVFDAFGSIGVRPKDLTDWLGHKGETLTPKELSDLRGLYSAIKDGETNWREVMDAKGGDAKPSTEGKPKDLKEALEKTGKKAPDRAPHEPTDPLQAAHDAMASATTEEALNEAWKLVIEAKPTKAQEKELSAYYSERLDQITQP